MTAPPPQAEMAGPGRLDIHDTNPAQASSTASGLVAGNYTVTATDANGCTATANAVITEAPAMSLSTSSTIASCGMNDGTATVNPSGGAAPYTYLWLITPVVQTTPTVSVTAGTYSVIVTDSRGCAQVQSVVVPEVAPPVADFNFDPTTDISMLDPEVIFQDASSGVFSSMAWDFGDTVSGANNNSTIANPSHTYSDTGMYCVTLIITTPSGACADTATKCLKVDALSTFYIPNSFTPNNDGHNEIFMAYGTYIAEFHLYIFDRWGNLIFESIDIHKGWDGTVKNNGTRVQEDVYVWKVNLTDTNMHTHNYLGRVTLVK
jgi:gliding motility-associated-like protein